MYNIIQLTFITDPSHGWLEVPIQLIKQLNIQNNITNCSYMNNKNVYLEEDLDAPTFLFHAKSNGLNIKINELVVNQFKRCMHYNSENI